MFLEIEMFIFKAELQGHFFLNLFWKLTKLHNCIGYQSNNLEKTFFGVCLFLIATFPDVFH